MSGAKHLCILWIILLGLRAHAAVWHIDDVFPLPGSTGPLTAMANPAVYPDTLCLASGYSSAYRGFGIREGLIYAGTPRFDLSYKIQYHPLMSHHQVSLGFPILNGQLVRAGVQFHYTASVISGVNTARRGSCSGSLILSPRSDINISLFSLHMMSFPGDSVEHLVEKVTGFGVAYKPIPSLTLQGLIQKRQDLTWQYCVGVTCDPWDFLHVSVAYEIENRVLRLILMLHPGRWVFAGVLSRHRFLGLTEQWILAYEH